MGTGQSYFRDLIFFEEDVAYGTLGTVGYKLRVNELTPRSEQAVMTNMVYTGSRMPAPPFRDLNSVGISFSCPMYLDEIGWILKHGIGEPNSVTTTTTAHTGKVGYYDNSGLELGDLPDGCSFEIGYTDLDTPLYHQFSGGRINELTIPFGAGGPAAISVNAICQDDDPAQTSRIDASPTEYTTDALSQTDISAITEGGGASTIVLGGEIRINNNLDSSLHTVGNSGLIAELPTGVASVTGTTRMMFQDNTQIDKVTDWTESSLGVTWTLSTHSLAITVPELKYNRTVPVPGSGSGLILDMSWEAFVGDHADATLLKYVLTNSVPAY